MRWLPNAARHPACRAKSLQPPTPVIPGTPSGLRERSLDVGHRVAGQILGEFAKQLALQRPVIVLAQFAQGLGRRDDDEVVDAVTEDFLVELIGGGGGEAVFFQPAVVGIGGTAGVADARTIVVATGCRLGQCGELRVRLVAGIAEKMELGAVGDGNGRVLGELYAILRSLAMFMAPNRWRWPRWLGLEVAAA